MKHLSNWLKLAILLPVVLAVVYIVAAWLSGDKWRVK